MRSTLRRFVAPAVIALGTLGVLTGTVAAAAPAASAAAAHPYVYMHT